ncbi:thiazole biosynthesis/tRNA modification protein ThiI [Saccharomonospora marina XMU15]|uniref:Probable tRNA sulfurtransferase n=1 Tax=Saccharomonospora marina XMU15 TaxID=882083 RepID=H5WZT0_9PSEU|nr:tRNA uracil 4-sulfurtransferase ThiI [Saccharomonospora marina]EHR51867.1 thiazole biosynthesis/tRNA modification protein ThiI [Saccharomonospora marina XMU15]
MAQPCVLLKYGELMLKGRNRGRFEQYLLDGVRRVVRGETDSADGADGAAGAADHADVAAGAPRGPRVRISRRDGVLVLAGGLPLPELVERAQRVFGVSVVQPALRAGKTPSDAADAVLQALAERFGTPEQSGPRRFAVKARRRNKGFPMGSEQLAAYVGQRVCEQWGWPVDLSEPEVRISVEVDRREVFVSLERHRGQGGLPVGASGRALVLLSGGFDSPVAAFRAMRRGLRCDFVHFTGAPYTDPSSAYKAYALVRQLDRYQGGSRLHVVPIGNAQRAIATAGAAQLQVVAQRRLMVRTADALAAELGAQALVTGDSLGQVSSQTLSNLATVEAAAQLPLLRPLLAWDKDEIIAEARRIGTADISKLPDEDCCSLLAPPRVATRSTAEQLAGVERRLDLDELVPKLLADVQVLAPAGS